MHVSTQQREFLAGLGKSPGGQQLLVLIQAEIEESNTLLRKLSGDALLREQGKALFLDNLVRWLSQSPSAPVSPKRTPAFAGEPV